MGPDDSHLSGGDGYESASSIQARMAEKEVDALRAELTAAKEGGRAAANNANAELMRAETCHRLMVEMAQRADKHRVERDEARERVAELEGIVNMAIEWFSNIKSSDDLDDKLHVAIKRIKELYWRDLC